MPANNRDGGGESLKQENASLVIVSIFTDLFCSYGENRGLNPNPVSNRTSTSCTSLIMCLKGQTGQKATQRPPYANHLLLAVPFLAWRNCPHQVGEQDPYLSASVGPGRVLLQELLWQFEQRECPSLDEEPQCCSHGALGSRRSLTLDRWLALIPASECKLLERLCARIPPSQTAAVLFRFREILAHNYVFPWELVCIFEQLLRDFLRRQEEVAYRRIFSPASTMLFSPHADNDTYDQKKTYSSSAEGPEKHREEIPTISSYVDRHLHNSCSYSVHRDCLPYCRSFPYD
ncbi:Protein RD3-like [Bagarius yarrelli]|uniref:Protein RD3-like n=1 Tax=Bagarius yarrelli TaxID=175774 RepID=A0A556TSP9_BAGYA|nr:Protein RD3-like [Bagarius yarrelli]